MFSEQTFKRVQPTGYFLHVVRSTETFGSPLQLASMEMISAPAVDRCELLPGNVRTLVELPLEMGFASQPHGSWRLSRKLLEQLRGMPLPRQSVRRSFRRVVMRCERGNPAVFVLMLLRAILVGWVSARKARQRRKHHLRGNLLKKGSSEEIVDAVRALEISNRRIAFGRSIAGERFLILLNEQHHCLGRVADG